VARLGHLVIRFPAHDYTAGRQRGAFIAGTKSI
jgi:hypothetical protein